MKKAYRVLAILLFLFVEAHIFGQIPNKGFDRWIDMGTYLNPEGWWTINDSVASGGFHPVTRSTDHFPADVGDYSIRLENNIALLPNWNAMGITWTGDFSGNDNPVFPLPGHPKSLWGYYKFFPQNGDSMEIHIRIYKDGTDVGGGSFKTAETAATWTPFGINFSDYGEADSARIMISSCYDNDEPLPHGNSVLYMDNLNFDHLITVGTSDVAAESKISIYPNPASEHLSLQIGNNPGKQVELSVFNAFGQKVLSQNISNFTGPIILDLSKSPGGTYFIHAITDKQARYSTKVIIMR